MKNIRSTFITVACSTFLGIASAETVSAEGAIMEQVFNISTLESLEISGQGTLTLINSNSPKLVIRTHQNVLNVLEVKQKGNHLDIAPKRGVKIRNVKALEYVVYADHLSQITLSGGLALKSDQFATPALSITLSGSHNINLNVETSVLKLKSSGSLSGELTGITDTLQLRISGASHLQAGQLKSKDISAKVSGSSDIEIMAIQNLTLDISGSSSVAYRGQPHLELDVSGASSVRQLH